MDEQRRMKVAKLAQAASRARARYETLGMRNTSSLTAEQRIEQDTEYALAGAEFADAVKALREELGEIPEYGWIAPTLPFLTIRLSS